MAFDSRCFASRAGDARVRRRVRRRLQRAAPLGVPHGRGRRLQELHHLRRAVQVRCLPLFRSLASSFFFFLQPRIIPCLYFVVAFSILILAIGEYSTPYSLLVFMPAGYGLPVYS